MCLKNINNNEKHSAKLVLSIFNPLHHTRDFLASFRGQHDYFGVKQAFWQREDNFAYFEMAENPSKSGKHLKLKSIPSFLGDVWLIKVLSEFLFRHPKCHFWARKNGHFCPIVHFWVQKMALWVPKQKFWKHFYKSNIPQKWWNRHLFWAIITFEHDFEGF